jgi:DcaP outer membrane protein
LRQAYGEYGGWLIGQTWSTFMDLDDLPETVDFNGPIGAPFSRRAMVRYSFGDAKAGVRFTFAAEDPEDQFGGASGSERMPQLVARVDKSFGWGAVNARLLVHEKRSFAQTKRGFGVGVGASYKLSDKDLLVSQYTRVDGDIDQLYGSNGYGVGADTGNITFDRNQGMVLGYARTFTSRLRGSVVLGLNRGKTAQAVDNKTLSELFVNLIYSPIKNVELGSELIFGKRETFDREAGRLFRFDLMGRYSF